MTSTIKAPLPSIQVLEWPAELTAAITRLANAVADKLEATEVTNSMGTALEDMEAKLDKIEVVLGRLQVSKYDDMEAEGGVVVVDVLQVPKAEDAKAADPVYWEHVGDVVTEHSKPDIPFSEWVEDDVRGDPEYVAFAKMLEVLGDRIHDPNNEAVEAYKHAYKVVDDIARQYYGYW
jgi:hypothetical protein